MRHDDSGSDAAARLVAAILEGPSPGYAGRMLATKQTSARLLRPEVVEVYPHDVWAFTQGVALGNGVLYESTGGYHGFSSLRAVRLPWGRIERATGLDVTQFGEGLAIRDGHAVQLTYREGVALVYDLAALKPVDTFRYSGEGWGLAFDGRRFVMSNGSDTLAFRDPRTFDISDSVTVKLDGQPVDKLNELECVGDVVYTNVFPSDTVLEVARDGTVTGVVDASTLLTAEERHCLGQGDDTLQRAAVLNGIVYDAATGTFLFTGKLWPKVFRVRLVPQKGT